MSDLISRQAAIDALKNRWKKTRNYEGIGDDIAEECELYLKQVPSAQPATSCSEFPNSSDCISRQAAIDGKIYIRRSNGVEIYDDYVVPVEYLKQLPPIHPERIRGHWICDRSWSEGVGMGESYGHYWKCDKCGHLEQGDWSECGCNFCSNCGSDNREVTT